MWSEAELSVSSSVLEGGEKGSLPVVATVFDKLNQVYKEYLEAEQSYTVVSDVSSAPFLLSSVQFHVFWITFVFVVRRRWSPVRVEAARLRSVRSELRRSSTNQTCTHTSCRRSQRGRYTNTHTFTEEATRVCTSKNLKMSFSVFIPELLLLQDSR